MKRYFRAIKLFLTLVWRKHDGDVISSGTAWAVAKGIWLK